MIILHTKFSITFLLRIVSFLAVFAPLIASGNYPAIHVEKSTNGQDADSPTGPVIEAGGSVEWLYIVTIPNPGDVNLRNITLTDDQGVIPLYQSGDTNGNSILEPTETWTYRATGTATPGQYENVATVVGIDPLGDRITDTDPSHYLGYFSSIHVEKSTNGEDADTPTGPVVPIGGQVLWTYAVTNPGTTELREVTLLDNRGVTPVFQSGDTDGDTRLDPSETWLYQAEGVATAGQYQNIATVTATTPDNNSINDTDPSHYFGSQPAIHIEKSTNGVDADQPSGPSVRIGSTVTFNYLVTNTGNLPLQQVQVTDDQGVLVSCPKEQLATGESMTCTGTGIAIKGQYTNIGTVTGTTISDDKVTDSDPSHYLGKDFSWLLFTIPRRPAPSPAPSPGPGIIPICTDVPEYCYMIADRVSPTAPSSPLLKYTFETNALEYINFLGVNDVETMALSMDGSTYYVVNGGVLGILDPTPGLTNAFTPVNPSGLGSGHGGYGLVQFDDIDGLSFDPVTWELYATVRYQEHDPSKMDLLIKVNPTTGKAIADAFGPGIDYVIIDTQSAGVKDTDDIAIDSDGTMYATAGISGGGGADHEIIIDKQTGAVSLFTPLLNSSGQPIQDFEGLTLHNSRYIFGTTGVEFAGQGTDNSLYKIEKGTGMVEYIINLDTVFAGYMPTDFEAISCYPICKLPDGQEQSRP